MRVLVLTVIASTLAVAIASSAAGGYASAATTSTVDEAAADDESQAASSQTDVEDAASVVGRSYVEDSPSSSAVAAGPSSTAAMRLLSSASGLQKSSTKLKEAATDDHYYDVDPTSGLDENGENYIPFQWEVEIIKREYDDYVLPDGTVYRVPKGAPPPYRHRGPGPYNVPYTVFKTDETHAGNNYGGPKLVESWNRQLLELLMQSWYSNDWWDRYIPPKTNDAEYYEDTHEASSATSAVDDAPSAAKDNKRDDRHQSTHNDSPVH